MKKRLYELFMITDTTYLECLVIGSDLDKKPVITMLRYLTRREYRKLKRDIKQKGHAFQIEGLHIVKIKKF